MSIDYTTTALVAKVKRDAILPSSQNLYLPADIIAVLSDELQSVIVPLLMAVREEYLVVNYDQAITSGDYTYFVAPRAVGQKLRAVVLLDSAGNEIKLGRIEPEDVATSPWLANPNNIGFSMDNDQIILFPNTANLTAYSLRQKIFRRPNDLIATGSAGQITTINTATKEVTLNRMPSTWTTSTTFDMIKGTPSFRAHAEDRAITTISGFVLTFTATLPTDLAVGDWIAEAGFSPIPQVPYEVHKLLAQRGVVRVLEGMGDANGKNMAEATYEDMVKRFREMVSPRVDGSPRKVISSGGILRYGNSRMRGGR